ncbi:hypothetical protein RhiTH_003508 [Rhizoctonia solani]
MPLTVAQQITESFERSIALSTNDSVKLRRSTRPRRPSARKVLSDASEAEANAETEASSQAPSRVPTPTPACSSASSSRKAKEKSRKQLFGSRGARPGRITQPIVNLGTASNHGLPEPIAATEPHLGDTVLETQGGGVYQIVHISREEAVCRATNFLHKDALDLSDESLNKVPEEINALDKEGRASPMDAEGGDAPAQLGSAEQEVLGGGYQSPAEGVTAHTGSNGAQPAEEPALAEPPVEDSATEPEEEEEAVELGPGDSVSQQPPVGPRTFHPKATTPYLRPALKPLAPPHRRSSKIPTPRQQMIWVVDPQNKKSNPNPIDESDEQTVPAHKRQRFTQLQQHTSSPRSQSLQRTLPPQFSIIHPTTLKAQTLPLQAARHIPPRSKPPPTSNVLSALTWAVEFAKQAAQSRASSSQGASASQDEFGLLAQVLGKLQSNLADSSLPLQPKVRYLSDLPPPHVLLNDSVARLKAEAALVLGKHIRPRNKPVLADFPGLPRHIASLAIPELIATAMAKGAYETSSTNDEWAVRIFKEIGARIAGDKDVQDPPWALRGLMIRRISCFRGDTINKLRPITAFQFGFINAPTTIQDLRHNINLAKSLLPNSFHCRDPARNKDPYENPNFKEFIAAVLFHNPDALGVVYHTKFDPMPLPTIAFFLTAMQHTIEEWKPGHRVEKELDAKVQLKMYELHYRGLLAYQEEASNRFQDFQDNLFRYGIDYAGVSQELAEPYQPITRAANIRPDLPTTKARAKGKAQAVQ